MKLRGTITFYDESDNVLYEGKFHSIKGRRMMVERMLRYYRIVKYYHVRILCVERERREPEKKPLPFVRPPAVYNNIPAYQYK